MHVAGKRRHRHDVRACYQPAKQHNTLRKHAGPQSDCHPNKAVLSLPLRILCSSAHMSSAPMPASQ